MPPLLEFSRRKVAPAGAEAVAARVFFSRVSSESCGSCHRVYSVDSKYGKIHKPGAKLRRQGKKKGKAGTPAFFILFYLYI
jgi:hypothetical protein